MARAASSRADRSRPMRAARSIHIWSGRVSIALLVSTFACGIDAGADLFGRSSSGADASSGQGGTGAVGGSSSDGAAPATGGGTSSSADVASSSSSASATASSSSAQSSSSGMTDPVVECGGVSCPLGGQGACCWDHYMYNGQPQGECVKGPPDSDDCDTGLYDGLYGQETRIECQVPSQCPNGLCCGERIIIDNQSAYYAGTSCQPFCNAPDRILCDPLDSVVQCPVGTICNESTLLPPGYWVCTPN